MTRAFIRHHEGTRAEPIDPAAVFPEALASEGMLEFYAAPDGAEAALAFRMEARGIAVLILTPHGQHLGTYADPVRAAWAGYETTDRAAQHRRPARPSRVRRGAAREAAGP